MDKLDPIAVVLENVPGLMHAEFEEEVAKMEKELEARAYRRFFRTLNTNQHGVPQNRPRVYYVWVKKERHAPHMCIFVFLQWSHARTGTQKNGRQLRAD